MKGEKRPLADGIQDALNRMRRAAERGTGCHLTADMIQSLSISTIGSIWSQDDPRDPGGTAGGEG